MNRNEALDLLREHKSALAKRFGVTGLALYGSFARDQAADHSDVDVLVEFDARRPTGRPTSGRRSTWRTYWAGRWTWPP